MEKIPPEAREVLRDAFLKGEASTLPVHLGYFFQWYSVAEVSITTMLAWVLDFYNLEKLEYLVRGMDGRVKCERLRQAARAYRPLGPELEVRLEYFQQKVVPLRNKLVHTWPYLNVKTGRIYFMSTGVPGGTPDELEKRFKSGKAKTIHLDDLFGYGAWLHLFAQDLTDALCASIDGGALEIASPQSDRPKGFQKGHPPKAGPAKPDRRARKRRKKPPSA
jgi:hypothetical protein